MITCRTLGPVEIACDGAAPPPELLWRKHLALLVYLARSPRRARSREHLVGLLWGDRPDTAARHSLREAVRILRRCLGEEGVDATGDDLRLSDGAVLLDVEDLEAHAAAGRWDAAAALVSGEFLEGLSLPDAPAFEDWLAAERLHWRGRAVMALAHGAYAAARRGQLEPAIEYGRRALRLDPASAAAARAAVSALALSGERAAALEVHERHTRAVTDLGALPDAGLEDLAARVRAGRAWAAAGSDPAPRRGAESRRAPLVGRGRELAALVDAWNECRSEGRARVGLIAGDAGVGRTRLAEEVMERVRLDGASVAGARAVPTDSATPWSGVFALARGGLIAATGVGGAAPEALAAFAAQVPEWAERFPGARGAASLPPAAALAEVLRACAAERPIAIAVDDVQWFDDASRGALEGILRDVAEAPAFVLATVAGTGPSEALDRLRSRIGREVPGVAVRLDALPAAALHELARWAFPQFSDVEVDRIARRVATDSAGLPLLAVELLHAVALGLDLQRMSGAWPAEHHTLDASLPGDLPDSLVAAIRTGFRRLSRDAQTALAAASVLPEPVAAEAVGRGAGLDDASLTSALDELEWQRWLVADGRGYTFLARIVRDVIARDMLTAGQRRRVLEAAASP